MVCLCVCIITLIVTTFYSHTVAPYNVTITEVMNNKGNINYTCYADGGPGNSYQWLRLRDNKVVSMEQELTLNNTDPVNGGDYQCTITNIAGSMTSVTTLNGKVIHKNCNKCDIPYLYVYMTSVSLVGLSTAGITHLRSHLLVAVGI